MKNFTVTIVDCLTDDEADRVAQAWEPGDEWPPAYVPSWREDAEE